MVSIKLVWNGGIITHANNATDTYTVEKEKELIQIGYSNYKMQQYEPTKDLEELKEYFVGKDISTLIESETDEKIVFTNGITITEEDYEEYEGKETYNIYYKEHYYRLIFNDTGSVENVLKKNELKVEGVSEISGNETEGWTITFDDTKHSYFLEGDGSIGVASNKWWILSDEEKSQVEYMPDARPFYSLWIVALLSNDNGAVAISIVSIDADNKDAVFIQDGVNNKSYCFALTNDFKNMIENDIGVSAKKYKWYQSNGSSAFYGWTEYKGNNPINLEEFTSKEIRSETYLQRVIDSFQK